LRGSLALQPFIAIVRPSKLACSGRIDQLAVGGPDRSRLQTLLSGETVSNQVIFVLAKSPIHGFHLVVVVKSVEGDSFGIR
jgi:hypothetical protein